MKIHVVYVHTNKVNGKRYVGVTPLTSLGYPEDVDVSAVAQQLSEKRWQRHVYDALKRKLPHAFSNAIRKHGPESFEHRVLEIHDDLEIAFTAERRQIREQKSSTKEWGYNEKLGGQGCRPSVAANERKSEGLRKRWSIPGARESHSAKMKEVSTNHDVKSKLSAKMIEVSNRPNERARRADIARRKFSKRVQKLHPDTHEVLEEFSSIKEASKHAKVRPHEISSAAKRSTMLVGFSWKLA